MYIQQELLELQEVLSSPHHASLFVFIRVYIMTLFSWRHGDKYCNI